MIFFRRSTANFLIRSITYFMFTCFERIRPSLITHHEHNDVYIVVGNWDFILYRMQIRKLVDLSFQVYWHGWNTVPEACPWSV